ncbi:Longin-like domain-containing protein [Scheffersomyces xylosifermentans]|uniref:Longin-like domain-containing protein n=1 Tax=Scheffersomyces xylosifermentans TaxID=1304137 RepID=UPI00315D809E
MKVYSIYILNKAGGLIYQNDVNAGLNKLSANDYLVLAGTLHGVHAISARLNPTINGKDTTSEANASPNAQILTTGRFQDSNGNRSGLHSIETDLFNLYVFQSLTGIKFIVITSPNPVVYNIQTVKKREDVIASKGELNKSYEEANGVFKQLYVIYSDYVMKDPFYSLDMPIKSHLFDAKVKELIS